MDGSDARFSNPQGVAVDELRGPQLPSQIPAPEPLSLLLPRLRGARF